MVDEDDRTVDVMLGLKKTDNGQLLWLERRLDLMAEATGFDIARVTSLATVVDEILAGSDIRAAQTYTAVFTCSLTEAIAAVSDLKQRIGGVNSGA